MQPVHVVEHLHAPAPIAIDHVALETIVTDSESVIEMVIDPEIEIVSETATATATVETTTERERGREIETGRETGTEAEIAAESDVEALHGAATRPDEKRTTIVLRGLQSGMLDHRDVTAHQPLRREAVTLRQQIVVQHALLRRSESASLLPAPAIVGMHLVAFFDFSH